MLNNRRADPQTLYSNINIDITSSSVHHRGQEETFSVSTQIELSHKETEYTNAPKPLNLISREKY